MRNTVIWVAVVTGGGIRVGWRRGIIHAQGRNANRAWAGGVGVGICSVGVMQAWDLSKTRGIWQRSASRLAIGELRGVYLFAMTERFQILSTLGSGGRGVLYRAWDKSRNCDVALKRPHGEGLAVEELRRESRRLYALRHPNVVSVLEFGEDDEGPWLCLELIRGESLEARLTRGGPLGLGELGALVRQSLAGLAAAHEAGLLHLDLKAENVMLPWDAHGALRVKLVDFGLARPVGEAAERLEGSVAHMAPEYFQGGLLDERTDLYALGVVFYQALSGRLPFVGETKPEVITAHLRHELTPLSELCPKLSPALCAWVERLLSADAGERPGSAGEALQQFECIPLEEVPEACEVVEEALMEEDVSAPLPAVAEAEPSWTAVAIPAPAAPPQVPEPVVVACVDVGLDMAPLAHAVRSTEPAPVGRAVPAVAVTPAPRRRFSFLGMIMAAFVFMLVGQFALMSWLQHSRKGGREARLAELAAEEQPEGSDLDVRLLLAFLDDNATQEAAAEVLGRLRGGAYIDEMLREHLRKIRTYPAAARLVVVIGERRDSGALEDVLALLNDNRATLREAAWEALARITPARRLPEVLAQVSKTVTREQPWVEKFISTILTETEDAPTAIAAIIQAYRSTPADSSHRSLLFTALARHGGAGTLEIITEAISDPSEKVRRSAITLLAEYPTHDALPAIATRLPLEVDETCRTYLLIAAIELVERPGPLSQQALYANAQSLYGDARDSTERRYVLSMMSRVAAPETAAFFERFAAQAEPPQRREARQLAEAFRERLASVKRVGEGAAVELAAGAAAYRLGGTLMHREGYLVDWSSTKDWASWLVELPAAGRYELRIHQAHDGAEAGIYEVLLAGKVLPAAVVPTAGETKGFILGEVEVAEPGIYKLFLRPRKLPSQGGLFRVQKLSMQWQP